MTSRLRNLSAQGRLAALLSFLLATACGDDSGGGNNQLNNNNNQTANLCGNGEIDGLEECDDGAANSDTEPNACRTDCSDARCGDGVVDDSEECDDGPQNSDEVPDACRTGCTDPTCGDGVVDVVSGETCDDGNLVSGDNCSDVCLVEHCGNGVVDPGEVCDDGNLENGDGCNAACSSNETCGNGIVDIYAQPDPEECDDGNQTNGDGCSAACRIEVCGNDVVDPGEVCDDGNLNPGDGCSPDCQSDETCGNDYIDFLAGEQCDDGNHRSHDGCSSGCTGEVPVWTQYREQLEGIANHVMAYDSHRGVLVLFGGSGSCGPLCDLTFEHDTLRWREISTANKPGPRKEAMLAYDSNRQVMVLFGGETLTTLSDTWEYDGTDWVQVSPATTSPPGRRGGAMAFDASRGRMVLFGGEAGGTKLGDVWEYDGVDWMAGSTQGSLPDGRAYAGMVYDTQRQLIVMVGGESLSSDGDRTWTYDGTTWVEDTTNPWHRSAHAMAYDTGRQVVIVYGGYSDAAECTTTPCNDVWEYDHDGGGWMHAVPSTSASPTPRRKVPGAYVPALGGMVLMGGADSSELVFDDSWLWDGSEWVDLTARIRPAPRIRHAMVYDALHDRLVMFGGDENSSDQMLPPDTWFFEAEGWRNVPCAGPPACPEGRSGHVMVWDANREVTVLFGGGWDGGSTFSPQNDTWELDGETWTEVSPGGSPPARTFTAMAFHETTGKMILYGGADNTNLSGAIYADTWEYDGNSWTLLSDPSPPGQMAVHMMTWDASNQEIVMVGGDPLAPLGPAQVWTFDGTDWHDKTPATSAPSMRGWPVLVYDPLRSRTVLFGGLLQAAFYDDTWEWNGGKWTQLFANPPSARGFAAAAYHGGLRRVAVHGGLDAVPLGDLYFFHYGSPWPEEVCHEPGDEDSDGDFDCADPDCEGRPCATGTCVGGVCQ